MDAIVSGLLLPLVICSSNCLTRASKSEEGPDVFWVDEGVRGGSVS